MNNGNVAVDWGVAHSLNSPYDGYASCWRTC